MHIGASTFFGMNGSQVNAVRTLDELGFDLIELMFEKPGDFTLEERRALKRIRSGTDLTYTMHAPFIAFAPAHPSILRAQPHLDMLKASLYVAADLECAQVVMHAGEAMLGYRMGVDSPSRLALLDLFIRRVEPLLTQRGAPRVLIENTGGENELGNTPEEIQYIMEHLPVGFCYDIAHAEMHCRDYSAFKPEEVHVTDTFRGVDQHRSIGEGEITFTPHLKSLKGRGFDGPYMLECVRPEWLARSREQLSDLLTTI